MYGVNYAWENFGADFGGIKAWNQLGVAANATTVGSRLADMASNGASVVRWWISPDFRGDGIVFNGNTVTGLGGTIQADLSKALDLAKQNNLYLMLTLFSFDGFRGTNGNTDANGNPVAKGPNLQTIVTNSSMLNALVTKAVRPIAAAVAASANKDRLIAWDVINEPEWAISGTASDGTTFEPHSDLSTINETQMLNFVGAVITELRADGDALITVGSAAAKWRSTWTKAAIDFYQFHLYAWNNEVTVRYAYSDPPSAFGATDRPVIIGEFPLTGLDYPANDPYFPGVSVDYPTLVSSWYSNGYAGSLTWSVTDANYNWSTQKTVVKAFASQHSCETQY